MAFDPTLALQLLGLGLQLGNGPCQVPGFVVQVRVGNRLVELPGGQLIHRHPYPIQRVADRLAASHDNSNASDKPPNNRM